jgi:hypothetical protein
MSKYTTKPGQAKGENILHIDGNQSICPFVPAIPLSGNMGQIQIMRMPCTTLCPHSRIDGGTFHITCGTEVQTFKLDQEEKLKSDVLTIIE